MSAYTKDSWRDFRFNAFACPFYTETETKGWNIAWQHTLRTPIYFLNLSFNAILLILRHASDADSERITGEPFICKFM